MECRPHKVSNLRCNHLPEMWSRSGQLTLSGIKSPKMEFGKVLNWLSLEMWGYDIRVPPPPSFSRPANFWRRRYHGWFRRSGSRPTSCFCTETGRASARSAAGGAHECFHLLRDKTMRLYLICHQSWNETGCNKQLGLELSVFLRSTCCPACWRSLILVCWLQIYPVRVWNKL